MADVATSIVLRLEIDKRETSLGELVNAIQNTEGDVVGIDFISASRDRTIRDITVNITRPEYDRLLEAIAALRGVKIKNVSDRTHLVHLGGKIEVQPKIAIKNRDDLSRVYTPGVAGICQAIQENPEKAFSLTIKRNTVAVVSDGTAVLGLGDIGPEAAAPVMEGKAMLFKQLAGVDAFPICLDTKDTEEIIATVKRIAPIFGGINLEDIGAPRCFEIEKRLKEELAIPVFHDDQHGTAVVMLAGLYNALKVVDKKLESLRVVIVGVGAAGAACAKILLACGVRNIICVDRQGALTGTEAYADPTFRWLAGRTNPDNRTGKLSDVIAGSDVFIGVSGPGVLTVDDIKKMAKDPIIFAMANPVPEIDYDAAEPHARIMATGRSDYPNQINNVLCFPGMFRGALDCRAKEINEAMKIAAARAIASVVSEEELNEYYIIPSIFNEKVVPAVRDAVVRTAIDTGAATKIPKDIHREQ